MADLLVAIPGELATPTGGYAYARRLIARLPGKGIAPRVVALPTSFPAPTATDLDETARLFAALPPGVPLLVDGLAYGVLPPATIAAAGDRPIIALVHHPLGLEEGLSEAVSGALLDSERTALALATRVVVTSPYTGRLLAERFGVPSGRIHVAVPGTDGVVRPESLTRHRDLSVRHAEERSKTASRSTQDRGASFETPAAQAPQDDEAGCFGPSSQDEGVGNAPGSEESDLARHDGGGSRHEASELAILAIGAVTPRKGYDVLIRALAGLADMRWRATIVGALDRAPDHVGVLRGLAREAGLDGRVVLAGSVSDEELEAHYRRADIVVSSSLFEGYGMALAESLVRGLPIVMARGGAADETVPDDAALKVPPSDHATLAEALRAALTDADLRARLASASREAGRRLPRWEETARIVADAVRLAVAEHRI